jgi:hypothetical protein
LYEQTGVKWPGGSHHFQAFMRHTHHLCAACLVIVAERTKALTGRHITSHLVRAIQGRFDLVATGKSGGSLGTGPAPVARPLDGLYSMLG